jgi:hypothetical protein
MPQFALYRSMHTLRGAAPKPTRVLVLSAEEADSLQEVGLGRTQAWSLHALTSLLQELAGHFQLLRSAAIQAVCREAGVSSLPSSLRPDVEARLDAKPLARALRLALEAGREAMNLQMTLAFDPDEPRPSDE